MFKWIGAIGGVILGSGMGVAGFGGAVNGWWIFGLMGLAVGAWIDNSIREDSESTREVTPTYTIRTPISCEAFLDAKQADDADEEDSTFSLYMYWVMGFISGVNLERLDHSGRPSHLGRNSDYDGIVEWLLSYCRNNPYEDLSNAAEALIDKLKGRN